MTICMSKRTDVGYEISCGNPSKCPSETPCAFIDILRKNLPILIYLYIRVNADNFTKYANNEMKANFVRTKLYHYNHFLKYFFSLYILLSTVVNNMFVIGHTVTSFFFNFVFLLLQHRSLRWEINQVSGGFFFGSHKIIFATLKT